MLKEHLEAPRVLGADFGCPAAAAAHEHAGRSAACQQRRRLIVIGTVLIVVGAASLAQLAAGQNAHHLIQGAEAHQQKQSNASSIGHKRAHTQQQQQQQSQAKHKHFQNQRAQVTADQLLAFQQHHSHHSINHDHTAVRATAGAAAAAQTLTRPLDHPEQPASLSSSLLRTYIRTNNMRAYHMDLHSYREQAKYLGDPEFVDSRDPEHVARCRRHLKHYHALVRAFKDTDPMDTTSSLDSLRLADTFGRPDAGLLEGHQFWLGSYEGCLDLSGIRVPGEAGQSPAVESVESQYCIGLAQFPSWNPKDTKTSIKIGMCLPETCTSSMLNEQSDLFQQAELMMKVNLGDGLPFNKLRLRSVYCLPHDTSEARQFGTSGKLFLLTISSFVLACLYATISDYLNKKTIATPTIKLVAATPTGAPQTLFGRQVASDRSDTAANREGQQGAAAVLTQAPLESSQPEIKLLVAGDERTWRNVFVESFSLIRNFEQLTKLRKQEVAAAVSEAAPQAGELPAQPQQGAHFDRDLFFRTITGLKCIGLLWIIAAHTFLVGPITSKNLIHADKLTKTYLANFYLSAHLMVDTFFALSGLLASYLIFKRGIHKFKLSHWIILTIHRYWRLTPVYIICYWFAKSLGHLVNSGPLWDYQTAAQSPRLNCANESWLQAFLYGADFKSPKSHCVPFAWFIANGIKFWIVTPIFLVAIYKSARRGYALVAATILANIAIVFSLAINSPVDMKSVIEFKPESADNMLNEMEDIYTRPYSRIGAYLVGLLAGHWFYSWELKSQRMNLSEKTKIALWSLVSVTMIVLAFVVKIAGGMELEEAAIPWVFSFCSAMIRPLWALCTCWLVFALSHGQARWLAKFLGARGWEVLAKLSFSAYLVQGEVIANLTLADTQSSVYTYTDMVTRPIVAAFMTISAAFFMAIFVEYPLIGIEELILPAKHPKSPSSSASKVSAQQQQRQGSDLAKPAPAVALASADSQQQTVNVIDQLNDLKQQSCDYKDIHPPTSGEKLKEL